MTHTRIRSAGIRLEGIAKLSPYGIDARCLEDQWVDPFSHWRTCETYVSKLCKPLDVHGGRAGDSGLCHYSPATARPRVSRSSRRPMALCKSPAGLAIDAEHNVLFAGCHNGLMTIINGNTGKVITAPPSGLGVDATRFGSETGLPFSSNGAGTLTAVKEESPVKFKVIQNVKTERGARTMEFGPKTHEVFLVTARFEPGPPERPDPHRFHRPRVVPGSFTLLVLAP